MSARCRCVCSEKIEQQLHAEVVDRRAEEHRRLLAGKISRFIERMRSTLHQLQLVAQLVELRLAQALAQRWRIDRRKDGGVVTGEISAGLVQMQIGKGRVGEEWGRPCRSRGSPSHSKKNSNTTR